MISIGISKDFRKPTMVNLQSESISALVSARQDYDGNIFVTIGILEDRGPQKIYVKLEQSEGESDDYTIS